MEAFSFKFGGVYVTAQRRHTIGTKKLPRVEP